MNRSKPRLNPSPNANADAGADPASPFAGFPQRSLDLDPTRSLPTIAVRAGSYRPFLFRKMIDGHYGGPRPSDGDLTRLVDREGQPLGFGLWNSRSEIQARTLARGSEPPSRGFWLRRLSDAWSLRHDLLKLDATTNAYRLIHAEGDGLTGLVVDRFDDVLSVEIFSLGIHQRIGPILEMLRDLTGVKQARVQVDERIALAEGFRPSILETPKFPPSVTIREHGVRYRVRFQEGHKTGFFCDQRDNRRTLAQYCRDRLVLDLCCYTGGFAISAMIQGQAREVWGVDLDEKAIAAARDNANLNQARVSWTHADAFGYMRQMAQNGREYGVIVLDPPKLISSRLEIPIGKRKYFDLNVLALSLTEPGGVLLTCSCSGLMPYGEFLELIRAAARKAGRSAQVLAATGAAPDHPVRIDVPESSYLKAVWLRVGDRIPQEPSHYADSDSDPEPEIA